MGPSCTAKATTTAVAASAVEPCIVAKTVAKKTVKKAELHDTCTHGMTAVVGGLSPCNDRK